MRKQVLVITDPETAIGFRLTGVKVCAVVSLDDARRELKKYIDEKQIGLIALSEDFSEAVDEALTNKFAAIVTPLLILIPSGSRLKMGVAQQHMLQKLIRSAIGFDLKLG